MKLRYLVPAVVLAVVTVSFGETESAATARTSAAATLTPVAALNKLLADAWGPLAKQRADETEKEVERTLEDWKLGGGDGGNTFKWELSLRLKNVNATVNTSSPPAFSRASRSGFRMELPRGAGFDIGVSGDVSGTASVKLAGEKIFTWSPGMHFGLRIDDFKLVSQATLDSSRPNRPTVARSQVRTSVKIGGRGFLPVSLPISFTTETRGETIVMRGHMTGVSLKEELSGLNAKLTADLVISLLPRGYLDVNAPETQGLGFDVDDVPIKGDFRTLKVEFSGRLTASMDKVGSVSMPFNGFDLAIPFPSPQSLDEMLKEVSGAPQRWGDAKPAPYGWGVSSRCRSTSSSTSRTRPSCRRSCSRTTRHSVSAGTRRTCSSGSRSLCSRSGSPSGRQSSPRPRRITPRPQRTLGSFTRAVRVGRRELSLPPALSRRLRAPGRYRLTVAVRDRAGNLARVRFVQLIVR